MMVNHAQERVIGQANAIKWDRPLETAPRDVLMPLSLLSSSHLQMSLGTETPGTMM